MTSYTVYQTTNTETSRFYIGVHLTSNPNDAYLGSGKALKAAVKKYGRTAFKKIVLFEFKTSDEAYAKEGELVTPELIASGRVYNLARGGVRSIEWGDKRKQTALRGEAHPQWGKSDPIVNAKRSVTLRDTYQRQPRDPSCWEKTAAKRRGKTTSLKGKPQSAELVAKRAEAMRNIPKIACPHCSKTISPSNLKNHLRAHSA